jgi:hypothetical protein
VGADLYTIFLALPIGRVNFQLFQDFHIITADFEINFAIFHIEIISPTCSIGFTIGQWIKYKST